MDVEREAKQIFTEELMDVVRLSRHDEALYLPTCSDFRGRSLIRSMVISYQGSDPLKAILEWAKGVEADEHTEFWRNCGNCLRLCLLRARREGDGQGLALPGFGVRVCTCSFTCWPSSANQGDTWGDMTLRAP